jgi:PKD repeat protein
MDNDDGRKILTLNLKQEKIAVHTFKKAGTHM